MSHPVHMHLSLCVSLVDMNPETLHERSIGELMDELQFLSLLADANMTEIGLISERTMRNLRAVRAEIRRRVNG